MLDVEKEWRPFNLLDSWPENTAGFDYVHMRLLNGSIADWQKLYDKIYQYVRLFLFSLPRPLSLSFYLSFTHSHSFPRSHFLSLISTQADVPRRLVRTRRVGLVSNMR